MISIISGDRGPRFCDGKSRRAFLRIGALALGGLSLPNLLRADQKSGRKKSAIVVCLTGGAPHLDTFDLKPKAPTEIRGEFSPIPTNVPGIELCELMPNLARCADKFSLIRSISGALDRHETHTCFSGWSSPEINTGRQPSVGSVIAKLSDGQTGGMPAFVSTARKTRHPEWGEPGAPGYLGTGFSAFCPYVPGGMDNLTLRETPQRLMRRRDLLKQIDEFRDSKEEAFAGLHKLQAQAFDLLLSNRVAEALDISREPEQVRQRYGPASLQHVLDGPPANPHDLLVARRLIEAGVRLVTVTFGRWDWHDNNFPQARHHIPALDQALSALIEDLVARGLDKDVCVLVWGEFGRTPRINNKGGRDHWTSANCALFSGGGLKMGQIIGATDNKGERPITPAIHPQRVIATLYRCLGIDTTEFTLTDPTGRPRYLLDHQEPIAELC